MTTVRQLLDALAAVSPLTLPRLCLLRRLRARGAAAQRSSLARSYRGDRARLLAELRREELLALFTVPALREHAGRAVGSLSRARLLALAQSALRSGLALTPPERAAPEPEEDEGPTARSPEYARWFAEQLAWSERDAATPLRGYQRDAVERVLARLAPASPALLHLATGGGKTRVANELLVEWTRRHAGTVLWVTKDWRLLLQAARDLSRRHRVGPLTRLGGDGQALHPLEDDAQGAVVYTTLHTLLRRMEELLRPGAAPTLLVWDECHWGEGGRAGKILTACRRAGVAVLGLTATPRRNSRYEVAFSRSFHELVEEGVLARPLVAEPVATGVRWRPQLRGPFEDVTRASLSLLALHNRRNQRIVQHYVERAEEYGKTLVFACSVEHVNALTRMFQHRGVRARPVHSGQSERENHAALEDFRAGAVQVLVNMEMLTHGVDVPDARTVFLCRPTTSDILFSQMVGRAARRDEATGKDAFHVVEFTDNVREHGELFQHATRFFDGTGSTGSRRRGLPSAESPRRRAHSFDPLGEPAWLEGDALPESLRGLWLREGQTFGVEFELAPAQGPVPALGRAWRRVAEKLRRKLAEALPGRVARKALAGYAGGGAGKDMSVWNVEYDRSAGWEVTSRVLANREGLLELDAACRALEEAAAELGLRVDHRTGTHVHLGWLASDLGEVRRALRWVRLFEPALATLVAPSRLWRLERGRYRTSEPNPFCRPLSAVYPARKLSRVRTLDALLDLAEPPEARTVTFNVRPLSYQQTVEVRLHSGTLDARKLLLWLSVWQQLLWLAAQPREPAAVPDRAVLLPDGDIVALAVAHLPDGGTEQQSALRRRLEDRRAELREGYLRRVPTWRERASSPAVTRVVQLRGARTSRPRARAPRVRLPAKVTRAR